MKPLLRFLVCLGVLSLGVHECAVLLRKPVEMNCGSSSRRHLTVIEAWPVLPSLEQWQRAVSREGDRFVFTPELPMCRYDGERGCWVPETSEQHVCTPAETAEWGKRAAQK